MGPLELKRRQAAARLFGGDRVGGFGPVALFRRIRGATTAAAAPEEAEAARAAGGGGGLASGRK